MHSLMWCVYTQIDVVTTSTVGQTTHIHNKMCTDCAVMDFSLEWPPFLDAQGGDEMIPNE